MSRASRERVLVPCMCIPTCTLVLCSSHLHTCVVLFPPAHLRCALPTCTLVLCSSHLHTCVALFPPAHLHCALPTCTLALRSMYVCKLLALLCSMADHHVLYFSSTTPIGLTTEHLWWLPPSCTSSRLSTQLRPRCLDPS